MKFKIKFILAVFILCGSLAVHAASLKALLVTGQNNHQWKTSSPVFKQLLEQSGLFTVEVATSPAEGEDMSSFRLDFSGYNVIVLDYNGDAWPVTTQQNFVNYVQSGGGVVVVHAADNAFPEWPEFNEIIGLGGWGNRNENWGPYVYWKDGEFVRDTSPGSGGTHGKQAPFQVVRRVEHPITRGLPEKWMHATDELYGLLRGPANNLTVLATAYSDPKLNGTGRNEPVLFTIQYGKGRIFHTVLGHVDGRPPFPAIECAGFITTLQRGAEWAATGEVAQKVPNDFPNADIVRRWPDYQPPDFQKVLHAISGYEFDQSRAPLTVVSEMISVSHHAPAYVPEIEKTLGAFLKSDATLASKQFVCQQLSLIGPEASVPVLAEMLKQPATFDMARFALERIPGEIVNAALRKALGNLDGKAKAGIIYSIGNRGDGTAIEKIGQALDDSDSEIATAAATALGQIGGDKCAKILLKKREKATGALQLAISHACLNCAESFLKQENQSAALGIYHKLYVPAEPVAIQSAAFRGIVLAAEKTAGAKVIEVLQQGTLPLQKVATGLVPQISSPEAIESIINALPQLSVENQARLLLALQIHRLPSVRAAATVAVNNPEPAIRLAALEALGSLGDAATVKLLARQAAAAKGEEQDLARASLYRLQGTEINAKILAILTELPADETEVKSELIRAVDQRRILNATDLLLKIAQEPDPQVRKLTAEVLKNIAGASKVPELVNLLVNAERDDERQELERTVSAVAAQIPGEHKSDAVLAALSSPAPETRAALYQVLGNLGEAQALPVLKKALADRDKEIQLAAIRALSAWPNDAPAVDLFEIAKKSKDETRRVTALRGYVRLIGLASERPAAETNQLYKKAMAVSKGNDDQKRVLAGLTNVPTLEALTMAAEFLNRDALREEAETAVIKISGNIQERYPAESKAALLQVIQRTDSDTLRQQAQSVLNIIERLEDYIIDWQLSGPYINDEVNIFDFAFPPENPTEKVDWIKMPKNPDPAKYWYLDLNKALGGVDRVAYLRTKVWLEQAQNVRLEMGSNDGIKAWLNDVVIHVNDANRGATPGEDVVEVVLQPGWNVLLLKIVNGGGGWGACARFRRLDGGKLENIRFEAGE